MRKLLRWSRACAVSLACLAWLLPAPPGSAAPPVSRTDDAPSAGIVDVQLDAHGAVRGRLLDAAGQGLADRQIILRRADGAVSSGAQTDAAGGFLLPHVSGGIHQLAVGDRTVTCRVWTHAAAPPSATDQLLVVAGQPLVRGQQPFSAIFTNPLFIGLVVAAAIAIPIAVHNAQDDRPPGS